MSAITAPRRTTSTLPVGDSDLDLAADVAGRDRVAGRAEPDAGEPVDLAQHLLADPGPQRRQRPQQVPLDREAFVGDRADLGVDRGVDLGPPHDPGGVGGGEVGDGELGRDHEVGLHVADEVLDEALGLGVVALAEVGPEPVVGREPHVVRGGDHQPRDRRALQAPHAVGQHGGGDTAERFEARGERSRRSCRPAGCQRSTRTASGSRRAPRRTPTATRSRPSRSRACRPVTTRPAGGRGGSTRRHLRFSSATRRRKLRSEPS